MCTSCGDIIILSTQAVLPAHHSKNGETFMNTRTRILALTLLLAAMILTACGGGQQSAPSAGQPTLPAVGNGENAGGEVAGVEAALVTYSDSTQGFAIGHPGQWTQDATFTNGVKFVGGDDYLTVEFVTPPAGTDAMTYAQNDVAAVTSAFPGFKQIDIKASTEVKNAIIFGFNADGKSGVTFTAHNERYYMPLADGRIAILTVVAPEKQYDREGVRDIALTFKVTK
jgi:hypothetical protein